MDFTVRYFQKWLSQIRAGWQAWFGGEAFGSTARSRHHPDPGRDLKSLRFTSTGAAESLSLCAHRAGAGPIVPPSMKSALIKLRLMTCFSAAIWLAHRRT